MYGVLCVCVCVYVCVCVLGFKKWGLKLVLVGVGWERGCGRIICIYYYYYNNQAIQ